MTATVREPAVPGGTAAGAAVGKGTAIKQAGETRLTRLESLRGLGCMCVLLAHILTLAIAGASLEDTYKNRLLYGNGLVSLCVFFAMSGFLLYTPFARHYLSGGRKVNVGRYARNRMLRILPLYYTVLVVLLIVAPHGADPANWWRWATFTQNFSTQSIHLLNAPWWSVAVEMHFYIALPILAWAIGRLSGTSVGRTIAILGVLGVASWILRSRGVIHAADPDQTGVFGQFSLPSFMYIFALGMLLAVARLAWDRRPPRWATWPVLRSSTAWLVTAAALQLFACSDLALQEFLIPVIVALVLGACVLPLSEGRLVRSLDWRPIAMIGTASFSLYLWHWPMLEGISGVHIQGLPGGGLIVQGDAYDFKNLLLIGVPLSIVVGLVSYRLIESPFLRQRKGWGATAVAPTRGAGSTPAPAPEAGADDVTPTDSGGPVAPAPKPASG